MLRYTINRLLLMIPTLFGVAVLVFVLLRLMPGDIVELRYLMDGGQVSPEVLAQERARLGLDKPLWEQFVDWITGILVGDFGVSMWTGRPVWDEISSRFQLSFQVAIMATILATIIAIPLGTLAALFKDTWIDRLIQVFAIAGLAVPSFWLGMLIILGLLLTFNWIPPLTFKPFYEDPWHNLSQLIWPALAVGYRYSAVATRMTRSTILEVLQEDYIRTARAKGLRSQAVIYRHALRNALITPLTVIGLLVANLASGTVIIEIVFNVPGVGRLLINSVSRRDYPIMQGVILVTALIYIVASLVVDLLYSAVDPRVKYE